jgi:thiol:disulfide interchange protein DsbA
MSREYRVSGVPQLAVNGKYLVIGQNYGDMLRIADELIEKERAALKGS